MNHRSILSYGRAAAATLSICLLTHAIADAQIASPFADGSDGALTFIADAGDPNVMTIDLGLAKSGGAINWMTPSPMAGRGVYDPKEWLVVFKYTTVTIPAGKTIRFKNHPKNPPVAWLVTGDVTIDGTLDLSAPNPTSPSTESIPGPGGFAGGGWKYGAMQGGAGHGPGGGMLWVLHSGASAGHAAAGGIGIGNPVYDLYLPYVGRSYGNESCLPLMGGSGGSGDDANGALVAGSGAGGGAILIVTNSTVVLRGAIRAIGSSSVTGLGLFGGGGSGGEIRIVANTIQGFMGSTIVANGGNSQQTYGADGRIRLEQATPQNIGSILIAPQPSLPAVPGTTGPIVPTGNPRITIASIGGAAPPSDPAGSPAFFQEDLSTDAGNKVIGIETEGVPTTWTVYVRVIPRSGQDTRVNATLTGSSGGKLQWTATVPLVVGQTTLLARAYDPAAYP